MVKIKKIWSTEETNALIARYKENPILLNSNQWHVNLVQKRKIQTDLATEFNTTVVEIGRKIRILRAQWLREYKTIQTYASDGKFYKTNWKWYKPLRDLFDLNRETMEEEHTESSIEDILAEDHTSEDAIYLYIDDEKEFSFRRDRE